MPTRKRLTGQQALAQLLEGNRRFISGTLEHPNHGEEARRGLVSGQEPFAVVLACADSRLPPVDIFDQGLGDVFVIRVAGNLLNDHVLGSIEYAVAHLNTPLVMVMGHASCGAISAVAKGVKLSGHIASLTPSIDAALKRAQKLEGDLVDNAAKELALGIAVNIARSEPIIGDLVTEGKVLVVASYYDLDTGVVTLLSSTQPLPIGYNGTNRSRSNSTPQAA